MTELTARERIEQERVAREAADFAAYNAWRMARESARLAALQADLDVLGVGTGGTAITVNDTLTSNSATEALSAKQGKALKTLIDNIVALSVIDNLTSTSTTSALSAAQGKALKDALDLIPSSHKVIYCTASSYTVQAADVRYLGKYYKTTYIRMDNASANTVVISTALSTLEIGAEITIRQVGAGITTLVADTGVDIYPVDALVGRRAGSTMTIKKTGTNDWDVVGEMP